MLITRVITFELTQHTHHGVSTLQTDELTDGRLTVAMHIVRRAVIKMSQKS